MQKQSVYIESSVISYLTANPSRDLVVSANQLSTQDWWNQSKPNFNCFVSEVVIDEISLGDISAIKRRMETIKNINMLEINVEIEELSGIYLDLFNIPMRSKLDAVHLAITVWHKIDYLLSWNCKHIANAMVNKRLREYNIINNHHVPILCTPIELMESSYE